jgi:hypothetical protein
MSRRIAVQALFSGICVGYLGISSIRRDIWRSNDLLEQSLQDAINVFRDNEKGEGKGEVKNETKKKKKKKKSRDDQVLFRDRLKGIAVREWNTAVRNMHRFTVQQVEAISKNFDELIK